MSDSFDGPSFKCAFKDVASLSTDGKLSEKHLIQNIAWKVLVKKTEDADGTKQLSVLLYCNDENISPLWSVDAKFQIGLLSKRKGVEDVEKQMDHVFKSKSNNNGFQSFIKWDDILDAKNGYCDEDTIEVSVSVNIRKTVGLRSIFYDFSKSSTTSDATILVEEKKIYVNKNFISMYSEPLMNCLSSAEECVLQDLKYDEFLAFLSVFHHVPASITSNNVESVLKLAERFEVTHIFYQCQQFLLNNKDVGLIKKFKLADKYKLSLLHDDCMDSLEFADIEELKKEKDYEELSYESKNALFDKIMILYKDSKA